VVVVVRFVAGSEVENAALPNGPAKPHAPRLGLAIRPSINAIQRDGLGRRDGKRLSIALNARQFEVLTPGGGTGRR
jgi:hypothetical protein